MALDAEGGQDMTNRLIQAQADFEAALRYAVESTTRDASASDWAWIELHRALVTLIEELLKEKDDEP